MLNHMRKIFKNAFTFKIFPSPPFYFSLISLIVPLIQKFSFISSSCRQVKISNIFFFFGWWSVMSDVIQVSKENVKMEEKYKEYTEYVHLKIRSGKP